MKPLIIIGIILSMAWNGFSQDITVPLKVKVLDEAGNPCLGAEVRVSFSQDRMNSPSITHSGLSDTNGVWAVKDSGDGGVGIGVYKKGFYDWNSRYLFYFNTKEKVMMPFDPHDQPIRATLDKVINPIPMYVKRLPSKPPVFGEKIGYDLAAGDWVSPYGSGVRNDFVYEYQLDQKDKNNYLATMLITFPNEGDGIQEFEAKKDGSQLKSDHTAPDFGYLPFYKQVREKRDGHMVVSEHHETQCFYFRVRTELDKDGNVVQAKYGKIYGDSFISGNQTYYFNPDGTKNIEFNPKRNLFPDNEFLYVP